MPAQSVASRNLQKRFSRENPETRRRLLIEAAERCLAANGIQGFTIDRICREAGVSRGLINHYFAGKEALLAAVYRSSLYGAIMDRMAAAGGAATPTERLAALIDAAFLPDSFKRANLLVWLALWGAVATNPKLQKVHRSLYRTYRARLAEEIAAVAAERRTALDAAALARNVIALIDGLWLEWCLDPQALTPADARDACLDLLEGKLGELANSE
jgi:TetR/AcrR family transcriptional regulator, transcriptional repressor of bet genes